MRPGAPRPTGPRPRSTVVVADEQDDVAGRRRPVARRSPRPCSRPRASPAEAELSVLFVDGDAMAELNAALHGPRRARPTCSSFPIDDDDALPDVASADAAIRDRCSATS